MMHGQTCVSAIATASFVAIMTAEAPEIPNTLTSCITLDIIIEHHIFMLSALNWGVHIWANVPRPRMVVVFKCAAK